MSRKRRLSADELEIWGRVARTTRPLLSNMPPELPEPSPAPVPDPPKKPRSGHSLKPGPDRHPPPPGHDVAQPLSEALASAPVRMDKRQYQRLSRGKLVPEARIDLHGMTLAQAHSALTGFILRAHSNGARLVLVITGKGKRVADDGPIPRRPGALKHDVPHWLRMAPLKGIVLEIREAHARHGGSGAYYVYLRRAR
ncbi:MAG: DNA mismatch repair protein MutS [Rhodobacteraceae bacterium]|nr:MAG: DNA mismatch repair protein MutS [Paracoccaceae bacterium]